MSTAHAENQRFLVERSVVTGGMGTVYRAIDRFSGTPVALKVALDDSVDYRSRALSEAGALAALDHPAIVRLVASGLGDDGRPFLAMEWLEGEDLSSRLERGPLSLTESVRMGIRLSEGLVAAHAIGIMHRDLKPSNIFLPNRSIGHAKLVDFGLARTTERRVTATGAIVGTPGYMAPEQAMGHHDLSFSVDIFSLGAVLYECILGDPPFAGAHALAILAKVLFEEVVPLRSRMVATPAKLSDLIMRMLSKTPQERPTAAEVVQGLSDILPVLVDDTNVPSTELVLAGDHRRASTEFELVLSGEQQLVCVLVACFPNSLSDLADTLPNPTETSESSIRVRHETQPLEQLRLVVAPLGGRAERLLDGTIIASWRGLGTPRDLAARAARAALLAHERLENCTLALGSGLVSTEEKHTFGSVLDRVIRSMDNGAPTGVRIDDVTAGFLDARFVVEASAGCQLLVGRRAFDSGTSRKLAGKTTPCIGRERELRMLADMLEDCLDSSRATTAMVTAPAGIGKSRLCREFLRLTRLRDDVHVWTAEADELGAGSPYALIGAIVHAAVDIKSSDSLEERREKLLARVERHVSQSKERSRVAAMLGEIASIPFPESADPMLAAARHDPNIMAEQLRRAFIDWLDAETQNHPVLLVFEDMHWADAPSVKIVATVLNTLRDRPLMILGFARPEVEERFPALFGLRELQEIRLAGLTKRSAAKLVQYVLPDASADLVQRLVERAGGNTLYLEELVRAAAHGRDDNLPETVTAMVQARLMELAPEERRVVRVASVFGGAFWFGAISTILGGKSNPTTGTKPSVFDALVEHEILEPRQDSVFEGDREFVFRHALLREGAYALLSDVDRAACHLRAAEWLEHRACDHGDAKHAPANIHRARGSETDPERIAYHFELGGAGDRACEWFARAASNALHAGDPAGAVIAAERGITLYSTLSPTSSNTRDGQSPSTAAKHPHLELDLHISRFKGLMSIRGYTVPEVETSLRRAEE
ncbi:MAG TPA: protein kinase, partial [Polyangium sp.]|nr:protein kinase [Polyangium sp.]